MTSSWSSEKKLDREEVGQRRSSKALPKAKLAPEKGHGHCLVVCCLSDPLQLSKSQRDHYTREVCSANQWCCCCCSVTQSCPTVCDPTDCSTPGFLVHHQLPELAQLMSISWWCHLTISYSVIPFYSCLQSFPASGSFTMSQFFSSGGQSIGVSASTSVLPMNILDWSPLGYTGWISSQSKGLSRVFSNTTVQQHQFFSPQLSLWSNSHFQTWLLDLYMTYLISFIP